ncbi:MAG: M20/M25/M40 family metallo-hydrolase [Acidimicrobiia bacterium]|nr:M20/M25/M40 family metallo-hydrolase [Acidimicrobiia bacterium]
MSDGTDAGEVVELLQQLIRNECVNDGTPDSGNEWRSVETLSNFLGQKGTIIEPHPGRQSVVYRVPGTDPGAPALTLLPHLDVVPVTRESWDHDPFEGKIVDGYVWGRGAVDMLNVTAAMAAVFRPYLAGEKEPLPGDLVFAAVADEEAGGKLGAGNLVESHWDLVGCEYLLTEVASPGFRTAAGFTLPVTVAEKGPAWRSLRLAGTPGHGSQPYRTDNALVGIADAITRLVGTPAPVDISPGWVRFISSIGLDPSLVARLIDPDQVDGALEDIEDESFARWAHACTHLTVAPTMVESGQKQNTIPDSGDASLDVRITPGQDRTTLDDLFRKALGPDLYDRLEIIDDLDFPPNESDPSGPLWDAISDAANHLAGPSTLVPMLTPVLTDGRFFRPRGVTAYGVGLFDESMEFANSLAMFHGNNEKVSVASVEMTAHLLALTVERFGQRVRDRAR